MGKKYLCFKVQATATRENFECPALHQHHQEGGDWVCLNHCCIQLLWALTCSVDVNTCKDKK